MTTNGFRYVNGFCRLVWPRNVSELAEARAAIDVGEAQGLYIGEHPDGGYVPQTLDELKNFFDIKSIQFGKVPNLSSKGIEKFQVLESLWIEEFEPFDIGALAELRKLSLTAKKGFDVGFRLPKLTTILISKTAVQDCRFVEVFESLERLVLLQANRLESLNGLELASHLTSAVIGYAPKLTDLAALSECAALGSLELRNLKRVADYEPVFHISSLRRLIFSKCNAIASLRSVIQLKQLEHLALIDTDVSDGNLEPTLQLPRLMHLGIYPAKKHFHPSAVEVENAVKARVSQLLNAT